MAFAYDKEIHSQTTDTRVCVTVDGSDGEVQINVYPEHSGYPRVTFFLDVDAATDLSQALKWAGSEANARKE